MAENPMFYKKIVPLNRETHRTMRVAPGAARFGFAAQAHLIPAVIDEFTVGGRHLPVVFVPGPTSPSAVFLLGLRPGENVFVKNDGEWAGAYVPAFVRRYPFIIGEIAGADPVVCIDEAYEGLHTKSGEPLFLDSGEETPMLRNSIQFINEYMNAAKRTEAFLADLNAMSLFRGITIDVRQPGQESRTLHGLLSVDADKLNALSPDDFMTLRDRGYLPMIYAHLASLAGIERLSVTEPVASAESLDATNPAPISMQ